MAEIQLANTANPWRASLFFLAQFGILFIAVLIIYGQTLDAPFYLDDFSSIEENPVIYDWQGTFAELWNFSAARVVGYFSFALNYQIDHFNVSGYHIVNIAIHFLTGLAIFAFVRSLLHTPALADQLDATSKRWLPFMVALLFLVHPLHIQAVTYIVQRLTAMTALFYIAALACFIQARLGQYRRQWLLWGSACALFTILAFFTKQNSATLPLAILLIEWIFFRCTLRRLAITSGAALGIILLLVIILVWSMGQNPFSLEAMQSMTRETSEISRTSYLATQMTVLWWYLRLFFLPLGMHIDYDYPLADGFFQIDVLLALLGHLALIGLALYNVRRLPVLAFSLLFYYLAHAVESSVLPIRDVVFEHRTYLPNLGLCLLVGWLLIGVVPRWVNWRSAVIVSMACVLILSGLTWWRNQIWRDPIALWQDNVEKAPQKQRAWVILGKHLIQAGRPTEGLKALERSAEIVVQADGSSSRTYTIEALLNMVVAMRKLGQYQEALALINQVLSGATLRNFDHAKFLVNRGNVLYQLQSYAEAEVSYREAIRIYPQNIAARANLASALAARGDISEAIKLYKEILQLDPSNQVILENLARLKQQQ